MQQHSGQHLLSAILEKEHSANTLSWWMAESSPEKVLPLLLLQLLLLLMFSCATGWCFLH